MPLVSVLTCTFNQEQFVGRNIDSIRTQTFGDWEHIVLNDASTDKTKDVVMRKKHKRLKYLESKASHGPFRLAEVYNDALNACSGKYVAFLDGDDYALPDRLELSARALKEDEGTVFCFGRVHVRQGDRFVGTFPPRRECEGDTHLLLKRLLSRNFIMPCTVMVRKDVLDDIGGIQSCKFVWDYLTWLKLGLYGKIRFVDDFLAVYVIHSSNTSNWFSWKEVYRCIYDFYRTNALELKGYPIEEAKMAWKHVLANESFFRGRKALSQRRYDEAYDEFLNSLFNGQLRTKLEGILGLVSVRAKFPVEVLARVLRKMTTS
jgi:teichuronic acid biosynthesis glycosyltransferase TuaG